jgi:hypothetical protein
MMIQKFRTLLRDTKVMVSFHSLFLKFSLETNRQSSVEQDVFARTATNTATGFTLPETDSIISKTLTCLYFDLCRRSVKLMQTAILEAFRVESWQA